VDSAVRRALLIDSSSTADERTIDITTTGARTGQDRRIEIWIRRVDDRWYLSRLPGGPKPAWYVNLEAHPHLTVHLKHGVHADLAATAVPVTDAERRRQVFTAIIEDLGQDHDPAGLGQVPALDQWMVGSVLVEIRFDGSIG
jgi:deazaflavin-dependent oxidoreductase (nitroreductase family)